VGFALDDTGQLQRTDNGGSSWSLLTTVAATRVLALSPGRVLLVGPRGVRRSTNGGQEFRTVGGRTVSRAALDHAQAVGSGLFAWSARVVLLSTNGGTSWRSVRRPSGSNLRSLDFVNRTAGFAVDVTGRVFSTRNGGRRWTQLVGVGASEPVDVDFATSRAGFLSVTGFDNQAGGWILHTSDGGSTWRPQLLLKGSIQSIASPASGSGLALAGGGSLFTTASGGDRGTTSRLTLSARPRRLRKAGAVTVSGRLRPPEGRELVAVAKLERGRWSEKTVQVASNGSFTTSWRVGRTAIFVAQWGGDDDRNGAGSVPLAVRVGR
jgi:photosystem II stability/assembly factor-like uncharacterized protein